MPTLDRIPGSPTRERRALGGIGSDFIPYIGAIKSVDLGAHDLTLTGQLSVGQTIVSKTVDSGGGTLNDSLIYLYNSQTGTGAGDGLAIEILDLNVFIWNLENGYMSFGTNSVERLVISAAGNFDFKAGNLTTTGTIDGDGLTIGTTGGGTITDIKDEDNMVSDSQTALATQQSIKAYADTLVASGYVPYTGANASVDLGAQHFTTTGVVHVGSDVAADAGSVYLDAKGGSKTYVAGDMQFTTASSAITMAAGGTLTCPVITVTSTFTAALIETRGIIYPNNDAAYDMGYFNLRFKDVFVSGNLSDGTDALTVANAKAAYTHVSADGTDHTYIDQDLQTSASPSFSGLTTTGTITCGYGIISQIADSQGLLINGFDDQSAVNIKMYINASGYGYLESNAAILYTKVGGATIGFFTQFGYGYLDGKNIYIGSQSSKNAGFRLSTQQTPFAPLLFVSDDAGSRSFIICDKSDILFDFSHAKQDTPTLFIHSDAQSTTEWIGLTHDGTSAVISSGAGGLSLPATTMGDGGTTDYMSVSATGDVLFHGSSGLAYGEISCYNENDTVTIAASGIANKVQITSFDTNGSSNNTTPDHTNDHITITQAGHYLCTVSLHIESAGGGGADTFGFGVYKNNGTTLFENCHAHRQLAGGGGDIGSISISGIIDLAVNDTIELWCWNEGSTDNLVVDDATMTLIQIGGT